MFYVISGKTLLRGLLIILAAACLLWLAWNSLDLDSNLPSGGIVLWPKWMPGKGGEPAENGKKAPDIDRMHEGPEGGIQEPELGPEELAEPVESLGLDLSADSAPDPGGNGQFTIVGSELVMSICLPINLRRRLHLGCTHHGNLECICTAFEQAGQLLRIPMGKGSEPV